MPLSPRQPFSPTLVPPGLVLTALLFATGAAGLRGQSDRVADEASSPLSWHVQSTGIGQAHPGFSAAYSGPSSLSSSPEAKETLSFDLYLGARLWPGAEAHLDGLVWQGFGLSNAVGVEGFPNGEAFRLGTRRPDAIVARAFIRQTFALGSEHEKVDDDSLNLGGNRPVSRLTVTLGKISAKDIFDNNTYANDPRTQFMSWALMANEAWDYPADSLGFETGGVVELNEPRWAIRYGLFQEPASSNAMPTDPHLLKAWGMVAEFERRYTVGERHGTVRLLIFQNRANMGSYQAALDAPIRPADVVATRAYRRKAGFGLNFDQEITDDVGWFARLGWSDGRNEAWSFSDVDQSVSSGLSVKGRRWGRPDDTLGLAGVLSGASGVHQSFLAAGGTGILAGDGTLRYRAEQLIETYYAAQLGKQLQAAVDYQFVRNPAFNGDRGPVSVFGVRLHWEY